MRWQSALLFLVLTLPLALAGCTTPGDVGDTDEPIPPGHGAVTIYVKRPLNIEQYPIWSLEAVPRFVAFLSGDNETRASQGSGPVDAARGWVAGEEQYGPGEYPEAAVRDWMQPSEIWYEGHIPVGNYSTVRIEIIEVRGTHTDGNALDLQLIGDRISVSPTESRNFHIEDGQETALVFEALISQNSKYQYAIK